MKLNAHKHDPNCAACHRKIDPLRLAFDNFDTIGRWLTVEKVLTDKSAAPSVDAITELQGGRTFETPEEIKQLLLNDIESINRTFVKKLDMFVEIIHTGVFAVHPRQVCLNVVKNTIFLSFLN